MADTDAAALALLVPLFGIVFLFGAPTLAWVIVRMLAHRERMAMIQHGIAPGAQQGNWRAAPQPVAGVPPTAAGPPEDESESARCALRRGIRLTFIGLALFVGLSFIGYRDDGVGMSIHPGPWLLGGLIPLFIGLAQITIALLSGATLGPRTVYVHPQPNLYGVPGPAAAQPPGQAAAYDNSYTYRPGSTPELRKPGDLEQR
ncbi:MAG TPA: DUF6249 domain-containing protein [Candidatus Baltobacteraceae bacterium]|nr:DUF6249 domain-containing protein [Candidatus Baltobacteraceae bacterium]